MTELLKIEVMRGFELIGQHTFSQGQQILIGRSKDADVMLPAQDVSRRHALALPCAEGIELRDLSSNGVFVDGERLPPSSTLTHGTTVEVGSFSICLGSSDKTDGDGDRLALRQTILSELIDHIDLSVVQKKDQELRARVEAALNRIARANGITDERELLRLVSELSDEALKLGPLEQLLADEAVSEIMVVDASTVYVERNGRLEKSELTFTSNEAVYAIIERIITPLGRRIDESSPMVDARLADGSRVNAIIPPLALRGPAITIRKFSDNPFTMADLTRLGSMDQAMSDILEQAVLARMNIVISGGTGSGKTTLLGTLASVIPKGERIITVEDAAELRLPQPHVVSLESKPPNAEGKGQVTIRDLVRNALRMRPDRIVVGECRSGEALDMLQAMNTGHDGSLTTLHANSPAEAVARLETLCLMAGLDLPSRAIREQIAGAINLIVQQARFADGVRRITSISEVQGIDEDGTIQQSEIFSYRRPRGDIPGEFLATGWLPSFYTAAGPTATALEILAG